MGGRVVITVHEKYFLLITFHGKYILMITILEKKYETQRKLFKSNLYPGYIPTNRVNKNQWKQIDSSPKIKMLWNCYVCFNKGLGAIRAKIGPTSDVDNIFSKMYSQYVLFINKYS
jgi:hypothetical protein